MKHAVFYSSSCNFLDDLFLIMCAGVLWNIPLYCVKVFHCDWFNKKPK